MKIGNVAVAINCNNMKHLIEPLRYIKNLFFYDKLVHMNTDRVVKNTRSPDPFLSKLSF